MNRADRDFDLVHTNLGAIGILVEVTFQAVPLFKVETKQIDLSNQLETLPDDIIGLVKKFDYANLYWFTENNGAILHTYNKVAPETPGNGVRNTWNPSFSSIVPWGYYKVIELLNNVFSENEMCLLAGTRVSALKKPETNDSVGYLGDMYMGTVCEGPKCLFPQVDDVEIAIPLDKVPQALRDIKAITAATKVCFPVFGLYVRFGLQSKTLLGPTSDGDKAFIEIHILRTRNGTPHLGFSAVDEIRQLLLVKYDGKPHYGKNFAVDFIGRSSKEFDSKIKRFDPRGIFSNKFLESRNQAQELSPGCAFERTCVCKADDHCYPGWVCTSGSVYKDASVCKKGKGVKCIRDDECASNKCQLFRCTGTS